MVIKKSNGKIFGAVFNKNEQKAIDMEIKNQLAAYDRAHSRELAAMALWNLHRQFGFGPKRLHEFYILFDSSIRELVKRYELDSFEGAWLCTKELREYGIDLEKWENELLEGGKIE